MTFPRSSGVLLHPTSLPSRLGTGDLGPAAYRFIISLETLVEEGLLSAADIHWTLIRTLMASVADTVLFPMQDL